MSHEWVQKQVEQFQFTFDQADKDKSGSLSFSEIYAVLQAQGFKGSEEEAQVRWDRAIKYGFGLVWYLFRNYL